MAALVFLLPRFINKEMVREKVVHLLSEKISGTVDYEDADVYLFPLPRVVIRNASLTIPEKVNGTIRTLTVFPELRPLFRGEVRLARVQIDEPSLTLHIPAKMDEKTKSLEEIAALLRSLTLGSTHIRLSVDDGNITLEKPERSPVILKEIGLSLELANDERQRYPCCQQAEQQGTRPFSFRRIQGQSLRPIRSALRQKGREWMSLR